MKNQFEEMASTLFFEGGRIHFSSDIGEADAFGAVAKIGDHLRRYDLDHNSKIRQAGAMLKAAGAIRVEVGP